MSDSQKPPRDITDYIPTFHDRESELQRLVDASRALSLVYLNEKETLKDAYDLLMQQALAMREALEAVLKRHAWTLGMGGCICQPHLDGYKALEQFDEFMKAQVSK